MKIWPTEKELFGLEKQYEQKGFHGCVGAIDSSKVASVQCETRCDADLYCCNFNVGRPGTTNDMNLLMRSQFLKDIIPGRITFRLPRPCCITQNGNDRTKTSILGDSIYPYWPFLKVP